MYIKLILGKWRIQARNWRNEKRFNRNFTTGLSYKWISFNEKWSGKYNEKCIFYYLKGKSLEESVNIYVNNHQYDETKSENWHLVENLYHVLFDLL